MNIPNSSRWPVLLAAAMLLALLLVTPAHAADSNPPGKMTFQGFLTDASSPPVPLGNASPVNQEVTFRIYDNATDGAVKWAETQIVTVDKGHFSVLLGEGSSVSGQPHSTDLSGVFIGADASDRWLGITLDGAEITPRIQFFAAPYAQLAKAANSLVDPSGGTILNLANGKLEGTAELTLNPGPLTVIGNATVSGTVGIGTTSPSTMLQIGEGANGGPGGLKINTGWINPGDPAENRPFEVQVRGDSKLVVNTQGNVGIGTASPAARLHVGGGGILLDQQNTIELGSGLAKEVNNGKIGYQTFSSGLDIVGAGADVNSRKVTIHAQGGTEFRGNVGIGSSAPSSLLDIGPGPHWRPLTVRGSEGTDAVVMGNISGKAAIGGHSGALNAWADLTINPGGGKVGIGTSNPQAPLHVVGAAWHRWAYGYLNRNGAGATSGANDTPLSIIADNRIGAAEFNAFSDARTKRVVGPSDNHLDLEIIQKLRVTDYQLIDTVTQGDAVKKGFIAQEVETVVPEAVSSTPRFVPDIYSLPSSFQFDEQRHSLAVILPKAHGLKAGDRVRIIADESQLELSVADVPSATEFVVEKVEKAPEQIFVYGKEVPDFRTVNYDRIFTTGIGAIQELDRQVQALKQSEARIAELEQKTAGLAELEQKAARVDSLEREVAELKQLVADLARLAPVKDVASLRE